MLGPQQTLSHTHRQIISVHIVHLAVLVYVIQHTHDVTQHVLMSDWELLEKSAKKNGKLPMMHYKIKHKITNTAYSCSCKFIFWNCTVSPQNYQATLKEYSIVYVLEADEQ